MVNLGTPWSQGGWRNANFAKDFGRAWEWLESHSPASLVYGSWDYEDPDSMSSWSNAPVVGRFAASRLNEMRKAENDRWKKELQDFYGVDDIAYPFRAGLVSGYNGNEGISDSVKDLYDISLRKWSK